VAEEPGEDQRVEGEGRAVGRQRLQRLDKGLLAGLVLREAAPLGVEPLAEHRGLGCGIGRLDEVEGLPGVIPSPSQVSPKEPIPLLRRTVRVANNRHTLRHLGPGDANRGFRCGPFSTLLRQPARLQLVSGRSVGLVAEQPQPSSRWG
jgi:hypothetical protein